MSLIRRNAKPFVEVPEQPNKDGCMPKRKLIYIKTHKTGSSTLSTIFHRFAFGHGVRVVLPKNALFLGWPNSKMLPSSYKEVPGVKYYEMFISAHTKYDAALLEPLVPDAEHVTVLREPASHFRSSFSYWGVPAHIAGKYGKAPTLEQLAEDPPTWWKRGLRSDRDLLENSMAFDLGLDKDSSKAEVEALIKRMDTWTMVMITEYMDHSLVMFARKMCWKMEDVAYYALKVSHGKKAPMSDELKSNIRKLDWMDTMLYQHFNASLWKQIHAAEGFWDDLKEMQRLKTQWAGDCSGHANMDVDDHRRQMLGERGPVEPNVMKCHLLQLDSEGFVKYLKQWTGVPHMECHRQGRPLKSLIFVPLYDSGFELAAPMFHRFTIRHGLRPAVPLGDSQTYGQYSKTDLTGGIETIPANLFTVKGPGPGRSQTGYDVIASGQYRFNVAQLNQLIPGAVQAPSSMTTILRDPVEHFWDVWNAPDITLIRLQTIGSAVTPAIFLQSPQEHLSKMPAAVGVRLQNGQVYGLGLSGSPSTEEVQTLVQSMHSRFSTVMIADHIDESIVMARRVLCWTPEDSTYPLRPFARSAKKDLDAATIAAIKEFNWADDLVFTVFNSTLFSAMKRELNFQVEVEQLREDREKVARNCEASAKLSDAERLAAMRKLLKDKKTKAHAIELMSSNAQFQCHTTMLSTAGFAAFFKTIWQMPGASNPIAKDNTFSRDRMKMESADDADQGARSKRRDNRNKATALVDAAFAPPPKPSQECAAQKFIYLKTHKTGSSTILSILHRYAFKYQLNSALPIDNMYLGWPTRKGALSSFTSIKGVHDYDVFCSGHSTWSDNFLRQIVPVGKQITILREPVSQFVSSWNHWHPYEHIVSMGGPTLTMSQFLDAPEKYWKYAKWSDEALQHNSYAYDFGITSHPTQQDVDTIISALQNKFDLVMITEYMDESLIMLRRIFCWDMEDILHFSLKVTKAKHQHTSGAELNDERLIRKLNWADVQIYDALNKTFWKKMEPNLKDPTFAQELAELRAGREEINQKCKKWENHEEDYHRLNLATGNANPDGCNMYLLDSKGFVKMLKRRVGIQTSECRTVSVFPMKEIVFVAPRWINNAKAVSNMIYRAAFKLGHFPSRILVPPGGKTKDSYWENAAVMNEWVRGKKVKPFIAAETFTRFRPAIMQQVVESGYLIAMVENPVDHFMRAWKAVRALAGPDYETAKPEAFFDNPSKFPDAARLLKNPQTYDLAGTRNPSAANAKDVLMDIRRRFQLIMVADRLHESLIMLRRQQCYDRVDAISVQKMYREKKVEKASSSLRTKIMQYNAADARLYSFFNTELQRRLDLELYIEEEIDELQSWNEEAAEACKAVTTKKQVVHANWILKNPMFLGKGIFADKGGQSPKDDPRAMLSEGQCHLMAMTPETIRRMIANPTKSSMVADPMSHDDTLS